MTKQVQFSENIEQAAMAADRYTQLGCEFINNDRMAFLMDLTAADGENGNRPLDWDALLDFPDFDFIHDCGGIQRHIDRETGKLGGCFLPRCSYDDEPDEPDFDSENIYNLPGIRQSIEDDRK